MIASDGHGAEVNIFYCYRMKQWEKGQISLTLAHILYSTHTFPPASVHLSLCGNPSPRLQVYSIRRSLPGGLHHFITQRLMYRALTSQPRLSTTCEPANYSHSLERSRRPVGGLRGSERRNAASELKAIKLQRTRCRHWALEIIQYLGAWEEDTCMCWCTCDILWHAVRLLALVELPIWLCVPLLHFVQRETGCPGRGLLQSYVISLLGGYF